ncbi:MAG: helix-turn-helix domain-containing protein [Micromonosporaceae bacterium]
MSKPVDPLTEWLTQPGGIAEILRSARLRAGLTGVELAERVGWQQSKVSKIENGRQLPTGVDVETWLTACGATVGEIESLTRSLDEVTGRHRDWRRRVRQGLVSIQAGYNDVARDATVIRYFATATVPGQLQTAEYARTRLAAGVVLHDASAEELADAVATRMRRQQYLYDTSKQFEFLLAEPVLRWLVDPPNVMLGQLDRLLAVVSGLPNIRFGILPELRPVSLSPQNAFVLFDDVAYVETFVGETVHVGDEAAAYHRVMDRLWADAVTGEEARRLIMRAVRDLQRIAADSG